MLKNLIVGLAMSGLLAGAALAETHEVHMLNRGDAGTMVFEPAFLAIAPGDTVHFLAVDRGHNAQSIAEMMPEGAEAFEGRINEELEIEFDVEGLYGIKCNPHFAMGMVMTIAVGDGVTVPDDFFEGRVPPKARERLDDQIEALGL